MINFIYKVRDSQGKLLTGVLASEDKKTLTRELSNKGYFVTQVTTYKKARSVFAPKVSLDALIMFSHQLSSTVEAGIPLMMCLYILWRQTENRQLQLVISEISNNLEGGMSLSDSFKKFPEVFPEIYGSLIEVAERGGVLSEILRKIVEYLSKQRELIMRLKKALTYPLIVIGIAICVVAVMLFFVVPVFKNIFVRLQASLPLLTQLLLSISDFLRRFWWLILISVSLLVFLYHKYYSTDKGRYKVDSYKIKLPLVGDLIFTADLARFVYSFCLLVDGGVPIAQSMESAKKSCANKIMEEKLAYVEEKIVQGASISSSLEETKFFPPLLTQMISIGEESGTLTRMLNVTATHLEEELDYRVNKLITMLEPFSIVFVGLIVIFILLAMYLPVFTLWGKIGARI